MKRSDGYLVRDLNPFVKIIPYVMEKRSDAQNFSKQIFPAESIDKYIAEKNRKVIILAICMFLLQHM